MKLALTALFSLARAKDFYKVEQPQEPLVESGHPRVEANNREYCIFKSEQSDYYGPTDKLCAEFKGGLTTGFKFTQNN